MKKKIDSKVPLVSIITVNYNHSLETCEMLESLQKITYSNYECIVVDNASPNDDVSCISVNFPEVRFIKSDKNLGFAGGNNLGMKYASGDILLFLNFDVVVDPHFLEPLVAELQKEKVGMVMPKICYYDKKEIMQCAGYTKLNRITLRNKSLGFQEPVQRKYTSTYSTPFVHGAAMAVNVDAVKMVGVMPAIYFLYYEELDWAVAFRKKGFKIRYVGFSTVYHKASVATGGDSPLKAYYMSRNRILFARRNMNFFFFVFFICYQYLLVIPKNIFSSLLRNRLDLAKAYAKGGVWHIVNLFNGQVKKEYSWKTEMDIRTSQDSLLL